MGRQFSELPRSGRLYLSAVICCGVLAIGYSTVALVDEPVRSDWLVLAALIVLTGSFSIKVPSVNARLSVSEAFVFAAVLLFGAHVGTVLVVLDSLILTSWLRGPSRSPLRALFNMASGAVAISAGARVLEWMLPTHPAAAAPLDQLLIPVLSLAVSYFTINSWLIATAVALDQNSSPSVIWRTNFLWLSLNYLGGASVALVLVSYTRDINLTTFGVIVPLLVVLYLTFRTTWGRIEDANRHITQVKELYLSTIETLAMAVDAKDQITHGHIRRVQVFAVELAKRLGVNDDRQIQAIATAALLHDMGKLAIPEHILNKPGKLTAAEFEKMKRHAAIGADLLSSVKFPYPVVPIVRHHHEQWDGSGYPTGISGTDIPLGARILTVVDVFDALTSDRPYRPRLTTEDAFNIIRKGRGTMYDPLIVDTFIQVYPEIAPAAIRAGQEARSIIDGHEIANTGSDDTSGPLRQIRANASETVLLDGCSNDLRKANVAGSALQIAAHYLRQLTPATVYALFIYDSSGDILRCVHVNGDVQRFLDGLTIKVGERVTGWTAANRRTSLNSDASLDLAQIASFFAPPLRSTLSTPLTSGEALIGVLTAYASNKDAFTDAHGYAFEQVATMLASRIPLSTSLTSSNVVSFPSQKH
jgi:putative nucleotidyltransferase with HDIG domain